MRHIRDYTRTETTAEKVTRIVEQNLGFDESAPMLDTKLKDDLGSDSLDLIEIQMCVEEEFGIWVPDADFDAVVTVGDLAQLVERLLNV